MKENGFLATLLMAAAMPVVAAHGSWSGAAAGPQLSVGKQLYAGQPLRSAAPLPPGATAGRISWRITLLSPPPPGLEIKLCGVAACLPLTRLAGQKASPLPFSPGEALRFVYAVKAPGQLKPPVRVVSHQITVNYHWVSLADN